MPERDFMTTTGTVGLDGAASGGNSGRPGLLVAVPQALARWNRRRWGAAVVGTVVVGGLIGLSTVLIPNRWFGREIAAVGWNYPVWVLISLLSGMLIATYVDPDPGTATDTDATSDDAGSVRASRFGMLGAVLGWFAVGCPVCNKIALIALGYSGALRWFAPAQPLLAVASIVLSAVALAVRLRGEIWCPVPATAAR